MSMIHTFRRWLNSLFGKEHSNELLTGLSATPDFPDATSLITWILSHYRQGIDKTACFCLETVQEPFVRLTYEKPVKIIVSYSPPFSPEQRLKTIGLPLPAGFSLTDWKRHRHFTLIGPKMPPHDMAIFIDLLFRKLYRIEKNYVLTAWTDIGPATHEVHPSTQNKPIPREKASS